MGAKGSSFVFAWENSHPGAAHNAGVEGSIPSLSTIFKKGYAHCAVNPSHGKRRVSARIGFSLSLATASRR
jgi:hypothetical protein